MKNRLEIFWNSLFQCSPQRNVFNCLDGKRHRWARQLSHLFPHLLLPELSKFRFLWFLVRFSACARPWCKSVVCFQETQAKWWCIFYLPHPSQPFILWLSSGEPQDCRFCTPPRPALFPSSHILFQVYLGWPESLTKNIYMYPIKYQCWINTLRREEFTCNMQIL